MRTVRLLGALASLTLLFFVSGCYTVVMVPQATTRMADNNEYAYEDAYDEFDAAQDSTSRVVNKYYIYGDLWNGYDGFDPFWSSPSWYNYHAYWGWHSDPWYWDSWYGDPWYYGYGYSSVSWMYRPGYCMHQVLS